MFKFALICLCLIAPPVAAENISVPRDAEIVVLGEIHDNPMHHLMQATIIQQIAPRAVVWEMLSDAQIAAASGVSRDDAGALEAALGWAGSGWPDLAIYLPVFKAVEGVANYGAAVPRDDLRAAMETGAPAAFGPETPHFDPDKALQALTAEDQAEREAEQAAAHCDALPPELLPGMVEAQRLRDARMAERALAAIDQGLGPVVIITGSGHARTDKGIPAMIRAARPEVMVWSLGQIEASDPPTQDDLPYDAVNMTPPAAREDPCLAFR